MPIPNLSADSIQAAAEHIAQNFEALGAPGLAASIVHDDELVWSSGFGVTDLATRRTPDDGTVARVASITKTFTATAIMQLRDEGKLGLDDELSKHIPEFAKVRETGGRAKDVTLRRLLTHYSGLSAETSLLSWGAEEFPGRDAVIAALPSTEVVIPADSQWKYSNLAFGLLGEVVERLSGVPYVEYMRANILGPLGFESTAFERSDLPADQLYTGYDAVIPSDPSRAELRVADYRDLGAVTSAGQLHSCVADLARWISFQFREDAGERSGSQVLSGRSLSEMHRPQYAAADWSSGQSLPWLVERAGDRVYHGHGGGVHGFASQITYNLPSRTGVVLLANAWPVAGVYSLGPQVMEVLLTGAAPVPVAAREPSLPAITPAPEALAPLLGYYIAEPGVPANVEYRSGDLWITSPPGESFPIHTPARMVATDDPGGYLLQGGRGAGERAAFAPNGESFTLGGWLYRRVDGS
jgi:CubicO group peptidase (beta-lactamase class C family)